MSLPILQNRKPPPKFPTPKQKNPLSRTQTKNWKTLHLYSSTYPFQWNELFMDKTTQILKLSNPLFITKTKLIISTTAITTVSRFLSKSHMMAVAPSKSKEHSQNYVVSPRRCCVTLTVGLILCLASVFILWPSDPEVKIVRLRVNRMKVHPLPPISADLRISVTVRVRNGDVYWMELTEVDVGVKYRGKKLGHVESEDWHVRGWGSCHVLGDVEFSGLPASDVVHLMEDMARGRVYFQAVAEVTGHLGLLFYHLPLTFKVL